jgi:hypothetical protein
MYMHEIMGNSDTPPRVLKKRQFRFTFLGWRDGWYVLLLRAKGHHAPEVQAFRKRVLKWLIEQEITPEIWSHMADSNIVNGLAGPAADRLWLLLRRASDVLRFEREFGARGITPETIVAAVYAEAKSHLPESIKR